ncbi:DUF1752 domain-containing protein [Massilia horti]|uniref:DUF1752 domain-containing protein n=1 Tax=Massilia horti TaxID=2562153 RepID=A0A4Y9SUG5_9BURK|nr:DUF1752 domain-containing protein [Massilia horti]
MQRDSYPNRARLENLS